MFVIKRAEALIRGISLVEVTQEKMQPFRRKLAIELHQWGKHKQ